MAQTPNRPVKSPLYLKHRNPAFSVEKLESRIAPAITILTANNTIYINGDGANNHVAVFEDAIRRLFIYGDTLTPIGGSGTVSGAIADVNSGGGREFDPGQYTDIVVNLGSGNDTVEFAGLQAADVRNVTISTGSSTTGDKILFQQATFAGSPDINFGPNHMTGILDISTGAGNDQVFLDSTTAPKIFVKSLAGHDILTVAAGSNSFPGDLHFDGNAGDTVNLTGTWNHGANGSYVSAAGTVHLSPGANVTGVDSFLSITPAASVAEGNIGTTMLNFVVNLARANFDTVSVNFETISQTAIAGGDYTPVHGTLTFGPGETIKTISVPVHGDARPEGGEIFLVNLSAPVGAVITDGAGQGIGTIMNDDGIPTGVPKTIDATHPVIFQDANHDTVTIKLAGLGVGTVSLVGGADNNADISEILLSGTNTNSALTISVKKDLATGDGLVSVGKIDVSSPLKSITAKTARLVSGELIAEGGVGAITFGDVTNSGILVTGKTALGLGHVNVGSSIDVSGPITALNALALDGAVTSAASIAKISVKGGALAADITAPSIGLVAVAGGDFTGTIISTTPANLLGRTFALRSLTVTDGNLLGDIFALGPIGSINVKSAAGHPGGNLTGATIQTSAISGLTVAHDVISALILAGTNLGADHVLGGVADTFAAGSIGKVKVGGNVSGGTVIAAGLATTNATLKDGDDTILGDVGSEIRGFSIAGTADADSYFAAGLFKGNSKIGGVVIDTAADTRFKVG